MTRDNFTAKQQAFIDHYLQTLNGTEAARLAGYQGDDATLAVIASQNLRKLKIRGQIEGRLKELTISADETLARISQYATGTMADFLTIGEWGVKLDLVKAEKRGKLGLIKKYKETETTRTTKDGDEYTTIHREVELYAADSAHDKLMRYYSLYNDKVTHQWQQEIIELIKSGRISVDDARQELGDELATELFNAAGIPAVKG